MSRVTRNVFTLSCIAFVTFAYGQHITQKPSEPTGQSAKKEEMFAPFTGKVLSNKVRVRVKADTESRIIRQVDKNELLLVVGEEKGFWAVQPFKGTKAYVFRSYILDNTVEGNRVNVRLEPHIDAPVIGLLHAGEKVNGEICAINHKWLEIAPPSQTKFYIAKEFIAKAGGPEYLPTMEKRKLEVHELLNSAFFLAEAECKKNYEDISIQEPTEKFEKIILSYNDFTDCVQRAKEGLALLKETYLQKKIAYLEARAELSETAKEELIAKHNEETQSLLSSLSKPDPSLWQKQRTMPINQTEQMRYWDSIEESHYLSWSSFHTDKKMADFYQEQQANATVLTGKIENFDKPIKNKPGDYILRGATAPIAYIYSTQVDMEKLVGETVSLIVSPRPNNHFAFPAYFVLSVE